MTSPATDGPRGKRWWAVAQMTGGASVERNLEVLAARVERAAALGCELVALPENCVFMGPEQEKARVAEPLDGPTVTALAAMARAHGLFVLAGSLPEQSHDPARVFATSVLLGPEGAIRATYRKLHLFDVDVAGDRTYRESDGILHGTGAPVVVDVNGLKLGLSICFDLRFPWLYQALRRAGAEVVAVPAAFTVPTGTAHWEVLLRARAIEAQVYVLAPGQWGTHETGRATWGKSMVVDPWGTVVATVADGGELAVAELDPERLAEVRRRMPLVSREATPGG
jgi:deaminated glutathione amidase